MRKFASSRIKYLYLISKSGSADYVTTSFEAQIADTATNYQHSSQILRLFNLELEDLEDYDYLTIDYTSGGGKNAFTDKYSNSEDLTFWKIISRRIEEGRDTAIIVVEKTQGFNLINYRRAIKIENIINE